MVQGKQKTKQKILCRDPFKFQCLFIEDRVCNINKLGLVSLKGFDKFKGLVIGVRDLRFKKNVSVMLKTLFQENLFKMDFRQ